jgi:hypothetical protein
MYLSRLSCMPNKTDERYYREYTHDKHQYDPRYHTIIIDLLENTHVRIVCDESEENNNIQFGVLHLTKYMSSMYAQQRVCQCLSFSLGLIFIYTY